MEKKQLDNYIIKKIVIRYDPTLVVISERSNESHNRKQQEPRLMTHLSKDEGLKETYANKKDLYATIVSKIFKKDYWDCMEHFEDGTYNPEGKKIRHIGKCLVLGIMYGMGAKLMSSNIGISVEECKDILVEFFKLFPKVKDFVNSNEEKARNEGFVEDYLGRRRHLPDLSLPPLEFQANKREFTESDCLLEKIPDYIDLKDIEGTKRWNDLYKSVIGEKASFDKKNNFKKQAQEAGIIVKDNGAFISKATTQCTNAVIQGSAASLTKKAMLKIFNDPRMSEIGFRILVPVHDELLGEVPAYYAEEASRYLSEDMIEAAKPECTIGMKVDTYTVKHWYADEVSGTIENEYNELTKGNEKKNIAPISPEEALNRLYYKYEMLSRDTVKQMALGEFDLIEGDL